MTNNKYNVFGVRHLSPAASYHLLQYLEEKQPKCILIEGPTDSTNIIPHIARKDVVPPFALLSYTSNIPIDTTIYPFTTYSPEYQAICWGMERKLDVRFIDLPSNIILKLREDKKQRAIESCRCNCEEYELEKEQEDVAEEESEEEAFNFQHYHNEIYTKVAELYGEANYDNYWERNFEHNLSTHSFQEGLAYQSSQIREMVQDLEVEFDSYKHSYNLIREAHMRRQIEKAISEGYEVEEIVIVVGAYHLLGIHSQLPAMTDTEYKALPTMAINTTLMPYSYSRLSNFSGYSAGNNAPYYYQLMWDAICNNQLDDLPINYLSRVATHLRKQGQNASSATVIEAVRLANALGSIFGGTLPVLSDLHDAVVTCFGEGDKFRVSEAIKSVDVGTIIGSIPHDMSQTPIQKEIAQKIKKYKLTKYKKIEPEVLTLDLREKLNVRKGQDPFLDLQTSIFLHQMATLGISFGLQMATQSEGSSWAEEWRLGWQPEVEIQIVEVNLKGETLEIALTNQLTEQLKTCESLLNATHLIRLACICNLTQMFNIAIDKLQELLVDSSDFVETVQASHELSLLIQYGSLRRFDLEPLKPILNHLFLRASLLLVHASACDEDSSKTVMSSINMMELIAQHSHRSVDTTAWYKELLILAQRNDLNSKLSGVAFSILLENNTLNNEQCSLEINRRLSPGVPAHIGAGWFEGLSSRNRYALLANSKLWTELDNYVDSLDEEQFMHALVFLRRAFSDFDPIHKNTVAELLANLWGVNTEVTAEVFQDELNELELGKLDELNDFDFDF